MILYVVRRLLYVFPIAIGVSLICFALIHLAPGDPISAIVPENTSPEMVAEIRKAYGFDQPLPVQYIYWLGHVLKGDFGTSIATGRPVIYEVLPAMDNSLALAMGAILIGCGVGIALGGVAGSRVGTFADKTIVAIAVSGLSIPPYWLAMVLIVVFAVDLGVLPAMGIGGDGETGFHLSWDYLRHYILPVATLSMVPSGIIARSVRASVAETLKQDFVQTLHAKGLGRTRIVQHVAANVAPSVLAIIGLQLAHLLGGSILVETVFGWPGAGYLLNRAIFSRDLPVVQGTIFFLAMFFVLTNLAVDILQAAFDPRLKEARGLAGRR